MASLKDIRRRIASVENTKQVTRAMQMVSAAKLRKAQDRIVSARPYAEKMEEMVKSLAVRAGENVTHPLLETREVNNVHLVLFTSDRGLCGSFNTNLIKRAESFTAEASNSGRQVYISAVGRKGHDYFRKRGYTIRQKILGLGSEDDFNTAQAMSKDIIDTYTEHEFDRVVLLFSQFYSPVRQRPVLLELLPLSTGAEEEDELEYRKEFIFEPPAEELLHTILPRFVEVQVFRAVLDNLASEHGARMTAMENATTNAEEMIDNLTLEYNRARQEAITTELMDIVGGAEAQSA